MKKALMCALAATTLCSTPAAWAQAVRSIPLAPEETYPEGIGYDPDGYIYNSSAVDGVVVRTSLKTGKSEVVVPPGVLMPDTTISFPRMLGLKLDRKKRLWMAGGFTARVHVVDTHSGKVLKSMPMPGKGGLCNDLVIAADGVYVTDTFRPILWRIPVKGDEIGEPEPWLDFKGTAVQYDDKRGMNGIVLTPDGKTLLVVQMDKGLLFKIDIATKAVTPANLGGELITEADGLELDGNTLYVARQGAEEVDTIAMAPDLASGKIVSRFKDPALKWPATDVKVGNELLVVNTQFNKHDTNDPTRPFGVLAIPLSRLSGK